MLSHCNVDGARTILDISWDEVWHIVGKAVNGGLDKRGAITRELIGLNEKAVANGINT